MEGSEKMKIGAHMVLGDLNNPTYTRYVDHTGRVPFRVFAALRQQPQKCGGHKVNGERVRLVYVRPFLERLTFKHSTPQRFGIFMLRRRQIIEPRTDWSDYSSAVKGP